MKKPLSILALTATLGVGGTAISQSPLAVTTGLEGMTDRYLTALAQQDLSKRRDEIAKIHNSLEIKDRQTYIRKTLMRELGGEWPEKTPLHAQMTGVVHHEDYTVQKLVYQSRPHFYVTADVYVPQHAPKPYPAVVGFAGHSGDGKSFSNYQTVWVSLAKRGFLVLAIDPIGQGERLEHLDPVTHKSLLAVGGTAEHMADGLQTLLTGTPIARYFLWDGIRAIDYLESRNDVDPTRIGVAGNSGGGTQSAYTATLDSRVAAAVISCYMTAWDALWSDPGPQDSEQVLDHFLADHLDFPDFLIRMAPKPVEMEVATRDFFPIAGAHRTFAEAKEIFHLLGAEEKVAIFEANDTHGWSQPRRLATYRWLMRWLQNRSDDGVEAEFKLDSPSELNATTSGQVLTSYPDAETLQSLNAKFAQKLREKPAPKDPRQLATLLRRRLALPDAVIDPLVEQAGSLTRDGISIEKIKIQSEAGITVPGLIFHPSQGPARRRAVLYLNPAGMTADAGENGPIEKLVREGYLVLALDPRGWGESAPPNKLTSGYRNDYQLAMRAILVGKSIPGMQTLDVLHAFHYLASRPDVDPHEISLETQGIANNLGIFAAVLEPKIKSIQCDTLPISFLAMTELKLNHQPPSVVVPGILEDLDLPDLTRALGSRFRTAK